MLLVLAPVLSLGNERGWQGMARLTDAVDGNPDPRIVEINLEARVAPVEIAPGVRVEAWTYNGGLPGR